MPAKDETETSAPKPDPSIHHEIGDDKGEGGQPDIKTDNLESHPPAPAD